MTDTINRAQGCLLGQLAGDALGRLVEFQSAEQILQSYPDGVRELADGGTWNTIAGQPADDSELALLLAEKGTYDQDAALKAYQYWLDSGPFDSGMTTSSGSAVIPITQVRPKVLSCGSAHSGSMGLTVSWIRSHSGRGWMQLLLTRIRFARLYA